MSQISLNLFQSLLAGNAPLGDYTTLLGPTWRRSIARRGGFKIGTVNLTVKDLTPGEMGDFFRFGLLREIREIGGGAQTWQGIITRMEWTHRGDVFSMDLANMYNARRALYRRLFDNLLTNGSAESGAWSAYNSATVTQSTEWIADGNYSCKIVVADAVKRGAFIQTGIAISAEVVYQFAARMNITSGSWAVEAYRSDNDGRLARFDSAGQSGDVIATFTIPVTNTYAGNIYIRVSSIPAAGAGTCYVDGAVFKLADMPADTGWKTDTRSIALYGRREWIDLWGGISYQAANARIESDLALSAWPQPDIPTSGVTRKVAVDPNEDRLTIVFAGYWTTLNWLHTLSTVSGTASALVTALAGYQSTYIASTSIATNTLQFAIEDSNPLRLGDVLKEICDSGDASDGLWSIGVYANRQLSYQSVPAELTYHLSGGRLLHVASGEIEPWLARPGWAQVDDMPVGPRPVSGLDRNDPRWRYLEEIEMRPPDSSHSDYWLAYSREDTA